MKDYLKNQMDYLEEDSPMEMEEKMEETHIWYHQKGISKMDRKKSGLYPQVLEEGRKIFQQGENHQVGLPLLPPPQRIGFSLIGVA